MNKVILMGRLTRDPEVRYSQGASQTAVGRFSIAVDRRFKREGEPDAEEAGLPPEAPAEEEVPVPADGSGENE